MRPRRSDGSPSLLPLTSVVKTHHVDEATQALPEGTAISTDIREALAEQLDIVIVATQNPIGETVEQIAIHAQGPLTACFIQNGTAASEVARLGLASRNDIIGVRLLPFNAVGTDADGNIQFNHKKRQIGVAPLDPAQGQAEARRIAQLFQDLGFEVSEHEDYRELDWNKLLLNMVGFVIGVTVGVNAKDGFKDADLARIEIQGLADLVAALDAEGINIVDFPWQKPWNRTTRIAQALRSARRNALGFPGVRHLLGQQISRERNNQPPAAAREIQAGKRPVVEPEFYLKPIIELGERHGLNMSVQKAAIAIISAHNDGQINLQQMRHDQRKKLLLEKAAELSDQGVV